jgi:hypothetical protein
MVKIYHNEGPKGFYRGLWPAIIQIMPYMGLLFSSYDLFSKGFKKMRVSSNFYEYMLYIYIYPWTYNRMTI